MMGHKRNISSQIQHVIDVLFDFVAHIVILFLDKIMCISQLKWKGMAKVGVHGTLILRTLGIKDFDEPNGRSGMIQHQGLTNNVVTHGNIE